MRIQTVSRTLLGTSLLLSACMVGPNYRVPEHALVNAPASKGAFVERSDPALSEAPLPRNWWRLYSDARLDALVKEALAANTDLRMADANLDHSRALLREAKTLRQPSVAARGSVEYAQLAGQQYLQPITPPRSTYYDSELTVGYDLDLFGGIRRGIEAATANDEAAEAARDLVRLNVAAETARAYAGACGLGLQLLAAKKSLALQRQSLELTQELLRGGRAIDLDVTRSQQLVDELTTSIPSLEAGQRNALYRLATLTGKPPSQFDTDLEDCATPPRLTEALPIGDGAALLKRRPDNSRPQPPRSRCGTAAFLHRRDSGESVRRHLAGDPGRCGRGPVRRRIRAHEAGRKDASSRGSDQRSQRRDRRNVPSLPRHLRRQGERAAGARGHRDQRLPALHRLPADRGDDGRLHGRAAGQHDPRPRALGGRRR
jgi:hypothetical protein